MRKITIITTLASLMVSSSIFADHDPAHVLPMMQVTDSLNAISLTTPSIEDARAELSRVPGGVKLIEADDFKTRAVGNIADVLQLSPGVFAQSRFGGAETRMSIRGSGITQTFGVRGI